MSDAVARLEKMGAAGEKSLFIHCVHIDESEMDLIAATNTGVVHNPESNMNNAVGVTKLFELLKRNILVGLGTDGMSSDMLSQTRCAYLLHRLANSDPRVAFRYDQGVEFINAITENRPCNPSLLAGAQAQVVMDAAVQSHTERKWLDISYPT